MHTDPKRLSKNEIDLQLEQTDGWLLQEKQLISRQFEFADFVSALRFVNLVGEVAERQQHHPDIYLQWGKVRLEVWTHSAGGLTLKDFELAREVDTIFKTQG